VPSGGEEPSAAAPTPSAATPRPARRLAPAQIVVAFQHPLRRATLRIDMNGERLLERTVLGGVDKNLLVVKTREGFHTETLTVKPGQHVFDVEVAWDDNVKSERIPGRFYSGQTYRLEVGIGRLRKNLSLKWTR
jgi:hypothetical protein